MNDAPAHSQLFFVRETKDTRDYKQGPLIHNEILAISSMIPVATAWVITYIGLSTTTITHIKHKRFKGVGAGSQLQP